MSAHDGFEEDRDDTVVVDRDGAARRGVVPETRGPELDGIHEHVEGHEHVDEDTAPRLGPRDADATVVRRRAPDSSDTDSGDDRTLARRRVPADADGDAVDDADHTRVRRRISGVDAPDPDDERTRVRRRAPGAAASDPADQLRRPGSPNSAQRTRIDLFQQPRVRMPDGDGLDPTAAPRPAVLRPAPAVVPGAAETSRVTASDLPSVARATRRANLRTLAVVACACIASVAGLVAIGFAALSP